MTLAERRGGGEAFAAPRSWCGSPVRARRAGLRQGSGGGDPLEPRHAFDVRGVREEVERPHLGGGGSTTTRSGRTGSKRSPRAHSRSTARASPHTKRAFATRLRAALRSAAAI